MTRTSHSGESEQRNGNADSSHQAAGLERQSDQSTFEIQHSMSCGPVFECKQWQTRRTRLQRPRWRTWTTANQFPKLRGGFRTHRPESRTGGQRASQDDPASQRREEVGKLQEDRSKTVISKAISEATTAVEKGKYRS